MTTTEKPSDPADKGVDQFQNHRAGYGDAAFARIMRSARNGGTLYAGEGKRIVEYFEARERELLAIDTPWPLRDVLLRLAADADHLLNTHDCDHRGWECTVAARDAARQLVAQLDRIRSEGQPPGAP